MKSIITKSGFLTAILILSLMTAGCSAESDGGNGSGSSEVAETADNTSGSGTQAVLNCPFTDAAWDNDFTAIDELEGGDAESYDSIYGGMTYTYDKEYMDKSGTIKYMFDGDDHLASVAWTFSSEDADEVMILYKKIYAAVSEKFGKGSTEDGVQNYSEIWKRPEEGNIILSSVLTGDLKAVQIAFLHPSVSHE